MGRSEITVDVDGRLVDIEVGEVYRVRWPGNTRSRRVQVQWFEIDSANNAWVVFTYYGGRDPAEVPQHYDRPSHFARSIRGIA